MADNETPTPNLNLRKPDHGEFENTWDVPLNENLDTLDRLFSAETLSGGHDHSGEAGQGPQIDHADLLDVGENTHDEIDTHIANTAIHSDTMIATVSGLDSSNDPIDVEDVVEIQFTNAIITDLGSGIVQVAPLVGGSSGGSSAYSKPESAAIAYTDNFNWPVGTTLDQHSWITLYPTGSTIQAGWTVFGTSVGTQAVFRTVSSAQVALSGGLGVAQCRGHVPHSSAQRVVANVTYFRPYETIVDNVATAIGGTEAYDEVGTDDGFLLSLDLASAAEIGASDRPVGYGISLLIEKQQGNSQNTLVYTLSVKGSLNAAEKVWDDFSSAAVGNLTGSSISFLEGWHELSLRRHPTIADAYYIHYYYNEGLMWFKLFDPNDANSAAAEIATEITALFNNLSTSTAPKHPPYGRIGFSVGYTLSSNTVANGTKYEARLASASITSQDDEVVTKVVSVPDSVDPSIIDIPACSSGTFSDINIGDGFDFDGDGPFSSTNWLVFDKFPDGTLGVSNGAGFNVQDNSYTTATLLHAVFCDSPSPHNPDTVGVVPNYYYIRSNQTDATLTSSALGSTYGSSYLIGTNLVRGPGQVGTFTAISSDIPIDWQATGPLGSSFYSIGQELATGLVGIGASGIEADNDGSLAGLANITQGGYTETVVYYDTGPRLPWGKTAKLTIVPPYADNYTAEWDNIVVGPAEPVLKQFSVLMYNDVDDPTTPVWQDVTDSSSVIFEGATLVFGIGAENLPVGGGFWEHGFVNAAGEWWKASDSGALTDADTSKCMHYLPITTSVLLYDRVIPNFVVGGTSMVNTGIAPPTTPDQLPPGWTFNTAFPGTGEYPGESLVQIHRMRAGLFGSTVQYDTNTGLVTPNQVGNLLRVFLTDRFTGAFENVTNSQGVLVENPAWPQQVYSIVASSQLYPRNPLVSVHTQIDTVEEGQVATVVIRVKHHHDGWVSYDGAIEDEDLAIVGTQFTVSSVTREYISAAGVIDSIFGVAKDRLLTVTGTVGASVGDSIVLTVTKTAAKSFIDNLPTDDPRKAGHPTVTGVSTVTLGEVSASTFTLQPDIQAGTLTGSFAEDEQSTITLRIKDAWPGDFTPALGAVPPISFSFDPNYFTVNSYFISSSTANGSGYWRLTMRVTTVDPGGAITADTTTDMTITNNGSTGAGGANEVTVPVLVVDDPVITEVDIYNPSLPDTPYNGIWNLDFNAVRGIYIKVSNVNAPEGILTDTVTLTPSTADSTISVIGEEGWVQDPFNTGDLTRFDNIVQISDTFVHGDTIDITVSKPCLSDTPETHEDTEVAAITFNSTQQLGMIWANTPLSLSQGTLSTPTNVELISGSFTPVNTQNPSRIIAPRGQEVFVTLPYASNYFEFAIPGVFTIDNLGDPTANFEVDFVDATNSNTTLLNIDFNGGLAFLTGANTNQLVGYALLGYFPNDPITVKITNTTSSEVTYYDTNVYISEPPTPRLRRVEADLVEGTTNNIIRIYGVNLAAPTPPAGAPSIAYSYALNDESALSSITQLSTTNRLITFSVDVNPSTAGGTVGLEISYGEGARAIFDSIMLISAAAAGTPQVEEVLLYDPADQVLLDNGADVDAPSVGSGLTAYMRVTGTDLNYRNVNNAFLLLVGEEDTGSGTASEVPPGQAWHPRYKTGTAYQLTKTQFITQTDEELVIEFPADATLANARVMLFLTRPASHPSGAGTWTPAAIDDTGVPSQAPGLVNPGLTAKYGTTTVGPYLNHDVDISAITPLSIARDAQNQIALGGPHINVTIRLSAAVTSNRVPSLVSVPDPDYGSAFTIGEVTLSSNKLELNVSLTLPVAGVTDTYPESSYDPDEYVACCGLALANGHPIFSVILGSTDWGTTTNQIPY